MECPVAEMSQHVAANHLFASAIAPVNDAATHVFKRHVHSYKCLEALDACCDLTRIPDPGYP